MWHQPKDLEILKFSVSECKSVINLVSVAFACTLKGSLSLRAGVEWAVSIAIGLGVIPLSLLTRWVSRQIFGINVPKVRLPPLLHLL